MDSIFDLILVSQQKQESANIIECNTVTKKYGLELSQEDVKNLLISRSNTLRYSQRIEFGESILPRLIYYFCDSQYINQDSYTDTLIELQEIFYTYKNETKDELTDDELLEFMKRQFEEVCYGDLEYLESTCLERFARAVRSGYKCRMQSRLRDEYSLKDTDNEYYDMAEETRWEEEVYRMKLEDLF